MISSSSPPISCSPSWALGALGLPPELNLLLALVIAAPLLFALGYAVQRGVLNNTLGKDILPPLLVTFALSVILQNGLFLIFSPTPARSTQARCPPPGSTSATGRCRCWR